jgi:hypothetical protein
MEYKMSEAVAVGTLAYFNNFKIPPQLTEADKASKLEVYNAMTVKERFACPPDVKLIPLLVERICQHWTFLQKYYG